MGGAVSTGVDNDDLIDKLMQADYIKSPQLELVFRAVDRGFYFLQDNIEIAYRDLAWKKGNLHLSAPCIYGEVMECLELRPGLSFLNLGSGTGYLSTMVGLMLGPYGVNHGVELHGDVIDYAYAKLSEFKKVSPALDCFEFCEPVFVKGNSLLLSSETRQYDRVYCGAACPENQENYMKNLLKVGGILVMPLNDNLMQITRRSETVFESKSILPVSFTILQSPSPKDKTQISLPEVVPLRLDEACRAVIRSVLRLRAQEENPGLCVRRRAPRVRSPRIRFFPNIILPVVESSDEDGPPTGIAILSHRQLDVVDFARSVTALNRRRSRGVRRGGESSASESDPPRRSKREKFDSGVVMPDSDSSSDSAGESWSPATRKCTRSSTPLESSDSSDVMDVEESSDWDTPPKAEKPPPTPGPPLYTTIMKEKLLALPLPYSLKSYLNYYRQF